MNSNDEVMRVVLEQGDRIRELVAALHISEAKFFDACGLSANFMSQRRRKGNPLSRRTINTIKAHVPLLNVDWLENGIGDMTVGDGDLMLYKDIPSTIQSYNSDSFNVSIPPHQSTDDAAIVKQLIEDQRQEILRLHAIIDKLIASR